MVWQGHHPTDAVRPLKNPLPQRFSIQGERSSETACQRVLLAPTPAGSSRPEKQLHRETPRSHPELQMVANRPNPFARPALNGLHPKQEINFVGPVNSRVETEFPQSCERLVLWH